MNNTIERIIELSVSLIMLSVVISVVFLGLNQSKDFFNSGMDRINTSTTASQTSFLIETESRKEIGMPAAACYSLLKHYSEMCSSCTCNICGTVSSGSSGGDCIKNHMTGRVILTFYKDDNGGYNFVISR